MNVAVEATGLTKRYGNLVALDSVNFLIEKGVAYGLVGANGTGKTTTARLLAGLSMPSEGNIKILGQSMGRRDPSLRRRMGVMPEGLALFEYLTGGEYLTFSGRLHQLEPATIRQRAGELMDLMDLTAAATQLIAGYSYGMRKKLALAAALLHRPELLILDEPLEGVDAMSRSIVERVLMDLGNHGVTIFLTSNSLRLVERVCSRVGILDQGRMVLEGSLDDLLKRGSPQERSLESLFLETADIAEDRPRSLKWP